MRNATNNLVTISLGTGESTQGSFSIPTWQMVKVEHQHNQKDGTRLSHWMVLDKADNEIQSRIRQRTIRTHERQHQDLQQRQTATLF